MRAACLSIMTASKSPGKVQTVVIGLLALWAIISIIIIVVWATSPDLKGSAQCRAELRDATEKMEGAKVVFAKDRAALEDLVRDAREDRDRLKGEILLLLGRLKITNHTLEECRQENVSQTLKQALVCFHCHVFIIQSKNSDSEPKQHFYHSGPELFLSASFFLFDPRTS